MRTRRTPSTLALRLDRIVLAAAFAALSTTDLVAPFLVGVSALRTPGCDDGCDSALVSAGSAVTVYGLLGVAVAALVVLLVVVRPDRLLWWLPCSALAAAGAVALIGDHLIGLGLGTGP